MGPKVRASGQGKQKRGSPLCILADMMRGLQAVSKSPEKDGRAPT